MQTCEMLEKIDNALEDIWKNNIKPDYERGWLLKEDTLKNSLYYHLRQRLGELFEQNDIRIFTEFTDCEFKGTNYRPDLVIAKIDTASMSKYWGDSIKECIAVVEIKYKTGFTQSNAIISDYDKLKNYVQELGVKGKLYMATIWEYEDDPTTWERKNSSWAKNKLVELNASYRRNSDYEMQFYVYRH